MACDSASLLIRDTLVALKPFEDVITILGIIYGAKLTYISIRKILYGLKTFIWPLIAKDINFVKKFGKWAVVTGCTDGIGKAYAHELARRKLNIVLISRSIDKLEATAAELRGNYGVETCVIQADFKESKKVYENITKELTNKDIGILVNNVGVMYDCPKRFDKVSEQTIWDHANINVVATTMMTHLVLPEMLERKRGAIINLSSSAAIHPLPMMAVYSATKAYVDYFSQALTYEYKNKGIVIQTLCPFYIATNMTRFSRDLQKPGLTVPGPERFVKSAIRTLGRTERTTGYWFHSIQHLITSSMPKWAWMSLSGFLHRFLMRH